MKTEIYIQIMGRVQGVNFRRRICKYASVLGLRGYAKNLKDGTIEIVAQGEKKKLQELLQWCQDGIFPTKVKGMTYEWREPSEKMKRFIVKKDKAFISDQVQSFKNLGKEILGLGDDVSIPEHVLIIPDGNRRWARQKGWHPWVGHKVAMNSDNLENIFKLSKSLNIKYLSLWGWSTENWGRSQKEIDIIFKLFRKAIKKWKSNLIKKDIRFRHYGRKDRLPKDLVESLEELEEMTSECKKLNLQFGLDYGGRDEIVRACNKAINKGITKVNEKLISEFLDSSDVPDPDLIIRTSGERRTSGIMAYQGAYAELYFTNVCFPDFDAAEYQRAILDYSMRIRRFGGTVKEDLENLNTEDLSDLSLGGSKLAEKSTG